MLSTTLNSPQKCHPDRSPPWRTSGGIRGCIFMVSGGNTVPCSTAVSGAGAPQRALSLSKACPEPVEGGLDPETWEECQTSNNRLPASIHEAHPRTPHDRPLLKTRFHPLDVRDH